MPDENRILAEQFERRGSLDFVNKHPLSKRARFTIIDQPHVCYTTKSGSSLTERDIVVRDNQHDREFILTVKSGNQSHIAELVEDFVNYLKTR